ncbi:hypothetical protein FLP41_03065 (plasmid) [Paracoccus marcusii]|nr:hypothetical protein FLP41_03065 [Paracoccus marcusii]
MSDWLTRFHTAARRIDAAPAPPEMSDAVFDALVEGASARSTISRP